MRCLVVHSRELVPVDGCPMQWQVAPSAISRNAAKPSDLTTGLRLRLPPFQRRCGEGVLHFVAAASFHSPQQRHCAFTQLSRIPA